MKHLELLKIQELNDRSKSAECLTLKQTIQKYGSINAYGKIIGRGMIGVTLIGKKVVTRY
jgi:hypothetical protein